MSGTHLALVVWLTRALFRLLLCRCFTGLLRRRPLAQWLALPCLAATWPYVVLTGGAASTCRAAVMVTALLLGSASGRLAGLAESLGLAVTVLVVWDPLVVADLGLQLSVAGVLGLAWASKSMKESAEHDITRLSGWRGASAAAKAAWRACLGPFASTAPIALVGFGAVPCLSPLANLVVVPYVSFVLQPASLVAMAWAATSTAHLRVLNGAVQVLMAPLEWFIATGPDLWPVWHARGAVALAVGAAVPVTLAAWWHRGPWRWGAALAVVAAAAVVLAQRAGADLASDSVRVVVLDVGHGDGLFLTFGDGSNLLVDAGGEVADDGRVGARAVVPFLEMVGVRRIDRLVISHAHPDHENGLLAVARRWPVGELWWNGQVPGGREHQALLSVLGRGGTRWRPFARAAGGPEPKRTFQMGEVEVRVVWPLPRLAPYSPGLGYNDNSLVLEVAAGDHRMLLAGDIERPAEAQLVQAGVLRSVDVLKVPHHGSRTSSSPALLGAVEPGLAVVSAKPWGALPFPDPAIQRRYADSGIPLWSTNAGAVTILLSPREVEVRQGARSWQTPAAL